MSFETLQSKTAHPVAGSNPIQAKRYNGIRVAPPNAAPVQRNRGMAKEALVQRQPNQTGLPDNLKTGVESLSGMDLGAVRVHYNSDKPAQLQALAYTQGTDIHVAPGQERHLPHEAWHVVQQAQGRVQPTMQLQGLGGVGVNDDAGLEREAGEMGKRALGVESRGDLGQGTCLLGPSPVDNRIEVTNQRKLNALVNYSHKAYQSSLLNSEKETTKFKGNPIQRYVTIGNSPQQLCCWSDIENKLYQSDLDKINSDPQIKLKIQNFLLDGEEQNFPYVTDLIDLVFRQIHPINPDKTTEAMNNSDIMPYATDAFFEGNDLMQGINKITSSVRAWSPTGVASGLFQSVRGLFSKRTWFSAEAGEHQKILVTRSVVLNNPELRDRYEETKRHMLEAGVLPNEKILYSGHGRLVMELIKKGGHHPGKTPYNPTKGFGAMGAGTYLTDRVDKAVSYASGNSTAANGECSIIEYIVLLGNIEELRDKSRRFDTNDDLIDPRWWPDEKRSEMYYAQSPNPRTPRSTFHSRKSVSGQGHIPGASAAMAIWHKDTLDSEEYLVRNPNQILPTVEHFFIKLNP